MYKIVFISFNKKEIAYFKQSPFYKYAKYKIFIHSNFCKSRAI
nr:MAG TPA: hypothetical protein [Caudoviricetes sp.]